ITCLTPSCLHNSLKKVEVNRMSLSVITFLGIPTKGKTRSLKSVATPGASMVSLQGSKMTALVQSWSVMVRMESYPFEMGSLTIKSIEIVWNGCALGAGAIGCKGGRLGWVLLLFCWQTAHPRMYSLMYQFTSGHQYSLVTIWSIFQCPW